jgi:plasmid stabilization system protein ParE
MALELRWSKAATKNFDKIITYLFEDWGETTAKTYVRKASLFLNILSEFPEMGVLENTKNNIRGFVLTKNTTVFYKVKGDVIVILNFYDNRKRRKK